jgi:hypothetical protein
MRQYFHCRWTAVLGVLGYGNTYSIGWDWALLTRAFIYGFIGLVQQSPWNFGLRTSGLDTKEACRYGAGFFFEKQQDDHQILEAHAIWYTGDVMPIWILRGSMTRKSIAGTPGNFDFNPGLRPGSSRHFQQSS